MKETQDILPNSRQENCISKEHPKYLLLKYGLGEAKTFGQASGPESPKIQPSSPSK